MRVAVDHRLCDGCGLCAVYAPHAFHQLADRLAYPADHVDAPAAAPLGILVGELGEWARPEILDAVEICPEGCLSIGDAEPEPDPVVEVVEDPVMLDDLLTLLHGRYHGPAYDEVVRVGVTGDDVHTWTASGSYHRFPRQPAS